MEYLYGDNEKMEIFYTGISNNILKRFETL